MVKPIVGPRFGGPAGSITRTGESGVALTFDDGPDPVQTPRMLDLLAEHHVRATAPGAKIAILRAPGGNFTPAYVRVATEMGMTSIYWQVDPRDWDHPAGESSPAHRARVIEGVEKHVRKGSIVLSHDCGQPDTIAAYRVLIPWLKARYRLVPMATQ